METTPQDFDIIPVRSPEDLAITLELFTIYTNSLGIDLSFQDLASELAGMPGKYAPPGGEILLARRRGKSPDAEAGEAFGCVALRPLPLPSDQNEVFSVPCCEMKRLYVAPSARGLGVGQALVNALLSVAENAGYREIRLDTLTEMVAARTMYRRAGFVEIPAYYHNPIPGTQFLGRSLGQSHHTPDTPKPGD